MSVLYYLAFDLHLILHLMLKLYWCATGLAPLAAFGWVMATHLSLYPAILIIPVCCCSNPFNSICNIIPVYHFFSIFRYIYYLMLQVVLLLGYGPDAPPRKLFWQRTNLEVDDSTSGDRSCLEDELVNEKGNVFSWRPVVLFLFLALLWSFHVLALCGVYVQQHGGLQELFKRFYLNPMTIILFWWQFCKWQNVFGYLFV